MLYNHVRMYMYILCDTYLLALLPGRVYEIALGYILIIDIQCHHEEVVRKVAPSSCANNGNRLQ